MPAEIIKVNSEDFEAVFPLLNSFDKKRSKESWQNIFHQPLVGEAGRRQVLGATRVFVGLGRRTFSTLCLRHQYRGQPAGHDSHWHVRADDADGHYRHPAVEGPDHRGHGIRPTAGRPQNALVHLYAKSRFLRQASMAVFDDVVAVGEFSARPQRDAPISPLSQETIR